MESKQKLWYAVQDTTNDDWDWGSYSYKEAVDMLQEQGSGLIAVIDVTNNDPLCVNEIYYDEIFEGGN